VSLPSQLVRHPSTRCRAVGVALGLLWSSACGGDTVDPEARDADGAATLDCNAPLSPPLIAELTGATGAAPEVPEAPALESIGGAEQGDQAGHSLLAINPLEAPYKVFVPEYCVPPGEMYSSVLKICVDAAGNVSAVTILTTSLPIIDSQLPYVVSRWRYHPYVVEGLATPFCYNTKYTVR
jgi:hypothetical protein